MSTAPRLIIIGLDCAEPSLVFERWHDDLPNLARLMRQGSYGQLESCIPAITVPAWSCMMSGRDPGELGVYGFRNRVDRSYQHMAVANSQAIHEPRLWGIMSQAGWKVAVLGVPGTYPPSPVNGVLVSCFLAPSNNVTYTYPPELATQIQAWVGDYLLDVPNFRSQDKERILKDIYTLCEQRFTVATHLLEQEHPDLLMLVEMGVDRIHHALWKHMDPRHPLHVPSSPFAEAIHDYYRYVDTRIGDLLQYCGDETAVLVVSDHGARPLMGGVCINEWLQAEGYLTLLQQPDHPTPLTESMVDWKRTKAWSAGGYYGRIFMNVRGREPEGIIPPAQYERERAALAERLLQYPQPGREQALPLPQLGEKYTAPNSTKSSENILGNKVFVPQQTYKSVRGVAPDLLVYFGDLAWRAVGTVGTQEMYTLENDTGPDDANHAQYGLFIFYDPQHAGQGQQLEGVQIYDILPTLLTRFAIQAPAGLRGSPKIL